MQNEFEQAGAASESGSFQDQEKTSVKTVVEVIETGTESGGKERTQIVINNNINVTDFVEFMQRYFGNRGNATGGLPSADPGLQNTALTGFVQTNISKKEGFDIGVSLGDPDKYNQEMNKLISQGFSQHE